MWPAARTGLKTWQIHYIYKDSPQMNFWVTLEDILAFLEVFSYSVYLFSF